MYDGGIHVPCYIRWPGHFPAGGVVDRIAAHIDLAPTLLDACGVSAPGRRALRRQEPPPSAQGDPDRRLARSDAVFPVAPRRPARARPGLRRALASLQARAARAPARRSQGAAARALRHGTRPARAAQHRQGASRHRFQDVRRITRRGSRTCHPPAAFEPVRIALGGPREPHDPDPPRLARAARRLGRPMPWATGKSTSRSPGGSTSRSTSRPARSRPRPTSHSERRKASTLLPRGRPSARLRASSCRPGPGDWKPGSQGTRPRPACST